VRYVAHTIGAVELALLLGLMIGGGFEGLIIAILVGSATAVGWLLASRLPLNPLGWMLLFVGGCFALAGPAFFLGDALVDSKPGAAAWLLWYAGGDDTGWIWLPPIGLLFTQVLLRFPDGRLPSPRWRWFSTFTIGLLVVGTLLISTAYAEVRPGVPNPVANDWVIEHIDTIFALIGLPLLACFLGSALSVVVRYRRAGSVERAQIRWVAWAGSIVVGSFAASFAVGAAWDADTIINQLVAASYALIPISIGIAVMRYRLYEIDRIVSRSISYVLVTLTVVVTYVAVVTSLTRLVPRLFPESSSVAVAVATLVAAAVFQPALRRVRDVVDRRFDRRHFDAVHIVDSFGRALRDEVDYDTINRSLISVIDQTLAPTVIRTWTPETPKS
jgi:hypothetical protein